MEDEKERQRLQEEEERNQNRKVQESLNRLGEIALQDEQEWNSIEERMTEQRVRRSKRINSNRRRIEEDWVRDADGKDYGCPECGLWFFTAEGVRLHMDNEHSSKSKSSEINEKMSQGKSLRYGCTDCENSYPSELMAINHMRSHNEEQDGKESDGGENKGEVEDKETGGRNGRRKSRKWRSGKYKWKKVTVKEE